MAEEKQKYRTKMGGRHVTDAIDATYKPFGPYGSSTSSTVGYINLNENEQFFTAIEVYSDQTVIATGSNALISIRNANAHAGDSTSSYAWMAHALIQNRNLSDRFSNSSTGGFIDYLSYFRASTDLADIAADPVLGLGYCGVVAVKKIEYGEGIRPLNFTIATSAGLSFSNTCSGDGDWGIMTCLTDSKNPANVGASAGVIFYDLGIALIHGPSVSAAQAISAVTAVTLQSTYKIWQLNAFCTAGADDFRYPDNPSAFYISAVTGDPQWNPSLTAYGTYGYQWGCSSSGTTASRSSYYLNRVGEIWGPYITTIGLYNITGECVAVAKLSAPVKKPQTYPITFRIALDFD